MDDILINFGSAVKALGNGRIGGYLVTFGDETTPDLSAHRDFFEPQTDYDMEDGAKTTVYFHHGLDEKLGVRKLGKVEVKTDDVGIWAEGILQIRDEYEREIYKMCETGKLSWSSGATTHLVRREKLAGKNASRVLNWPISEASLTPNPADFRNSVMAIKSADWNSHAYDTLIEEDAAEGHAAEGHAADLLPPVSSEVAATKNAAPSTPETVLALLSSMPMKMFLETMGTVVSDTDRRLTWYVEQRAIKQGRAISADNLAAMGTICDGMDACASTLDAHRKQLRALVDAHTHPAAASDRPAKENTAMAREFTRYLAIGARGAGATMTL